MSSIEKESTERNHGHPHIVESISYDEELDNEADVLHVIDEDDVGLGNILPQIQVIDDRLGCSEDVREADENDNNNHFEILPDEDEEDDAEHDAAGLEEAFLEKVAEETEGDLKESSSIIEGEKEDHENAAKEENTTSTTPSSSPPTQRKFFKLPVLSPPPRAKEKKNQPPGGKLRFLPQSVEKFIGSKMATYMDKAEDSVEISQTVQEQAEDFFSDDSSSGDSSLGDSSIMVEDDADQILDAFTLSALPNSFLKSPPSSYGYLDHDLLEDVNEQDLATFAWEHHLLSRGLMQLLAERDHIGVEDDIHETSNILKMGPLKKSIKQKLWTLKLVEIRKGNLTYYDDKAMKGGKHDRTVVHLRRRTCRCEAITKPKDGSSGGFVFALIDDGGRKICWMAKSEEEMEGWIRAINQAMIGETDESLGIPLNIAQYQTAVEEYDSVRNFLRNAETQKDYMAVAGSLPNRHGSTAALRIPMRWIREEVFEDDYIPEGKEGVKQKDAPRHRVKSTVADFWKVLCDSSIAINGNLIEEKSAYSGERIIGALSRCLLEYDKVDRNLSYVESNGFVKRVDVNNFLTEAQAVSHARSILTGALKSKSRNEALLSVEELMKNENVVSCVELKHSEPMHIDVSFAGDDFSDDYEKGKNDLTGWILSRNKKNRSWKERYFVLSEGVLSVYLDANPRPFGLRGQFVLKDSRVKTFDVLSIIEIHHKDHQRQLLFEERARFVKWKSVIDPTFDENGQSLGPSLITAPDMAEELERKNPPAQSSAPNTLLLDQNDEQKKKARTGTMAKLQKEAKDKGDRAYKAMKEAKDKGDRAYKVMKEARNAGMDKIRRILPKTGRRPNEHRRRRLQRRRPTADMLLSSTRAVQMATDKREPTVQVVVELRRVYKVIAKDPVDSHGETLMIIKVNVFHAFLVSGGANGRLARGDELIDMEFDNGDVVANTDQKFLEVPTAL